MQESATPSETRKVGSIKVAKVLLLFACSCIVCILLLLWLDRANGMPVPAISTTLFAIVASFLWCLFAWRDESFAVDLAAQAAQAEKIRADDPKDPEKAWTAARLTQELYYKRNLSQTAHIFNIAVLTMLAGFCLICWATYRSLQVGAVLQTSVVAAASGIITEFIAATFMVIYKSTMSQAAEYMKILERVNNVGMAIQVLANLPDQNSPSVIDARCAIAKMLIDPGRQAESKPH